MADDLGHERHGAARARIDLQHVYVLALDGVLHVHEAHDVERARDIRGLPLKLRLHLRPQRMRRERAGAVARMNARLLDVLHHARDEHVLAVANGVHIGFDGIADVGIEQQRILGQDGVDLRAPVARETVLKFLRDERRERRVEIVLERGLIGNDRHGPAAKHVGRPHHDREADLLGGQERLFDGIGDAVLGLPELELVDQHLEAVAVLGQVDGIRGRAENGYILGIERLRELERRLPAELHDHALELAVGTFRPDDGHHVLRRQRLEVQPVGGVVVRRDCLGIAVDHDGLVAGLREREGCVAAAIVELDALPDAVGAAAQDDDLLAAARVGLAVHLAAQRLLVGRVHVGRGRWEFRGAGIDALIDREHAEALALRRHFGLCEPRKPGEPRIRESHGLQAPEGALRVRKAVLADFGSSASTIACSRETNHGSMWQKE